MSEMKSTDELKSAYQASLLHGSTQEAYQIIEEALTSNLSLISVYTVIADAMYSIGDLWETNEISIAQEHAATAITQFVLTQISAESLKSMHTSNQRAAVFSVESNAHYLGIQMIKNMFNIYNVQTFDFGPNVPNEDIIERVTTLEIDIVAYSVTMSNQIEVAQRLSQLFEQMDEDIRPIVIVGGYAFRLNPDLLNELYYDHHFESVKALSEWLEEQESQMSLSQ